MVRGLSILALFSAFFLSPEIVLAKKPAPPESASPSSLEFIRTSSEPVSLEYVLVHFEKFDARLKSLSADFSQTLTIPDTGMTSAISGSVAYLKPERLRIEHIRPERQTVVSDGRDIWIHRHEHAQVIQSKLNDWKEADPTMNNLMQFGSYGKMLKTYDVELVTGAARPVLLLRPKTGAGEFSLRLELDPSTLFPQVTELLVGSMRVRTQMTNTLFNPPLKAAEFEFTPPAGCDVFKNFKPPRFSQ